MPKQRNPDVYTEVHRAADYFEALLRARFAKAMKAARKRVDQRALADAIAAKDPGRALSVVVGSIDLQATMKPIQKILRDAIIKGAKVGAGEVRKLG